MVKAKAISKPKAKPKNDSSMSTTKKIRFSRKSCDVPCCCECGEVVTDETKALQCERCAENETWKCANCLELSDELYLHLITSAKSNLHWFCDKCEAVALETHSSENEKVLSSVGEISSAMDKLSDVMKSMEQSLLDRMTEMECKLDQKADLDEVKVLRGY